MMTVLRPALATSLALASFGWAADRTGVADARAANPSDRQSLVARKFQVEADRLLGQVTSTSYRHRTRVVEAAGVYETDCKGLIAFLLRKISPAHLEVLPVATGRRKPRAVEYYEFFRGQPPVGQPSLTFWNRIPTLAEAQPGDILAWRYRDIILGKNTGHVLIIESKPERGEGDIYRVEVVDSTGTTHDDDTRPRGTSGIGKGVMWFKVNSDGQAIAYQRNSMLPFKTAPIEMGRMADR